MRVIAVSCALVAGTLFVGACSSNSMPTATVGELSRVANPSALGFDAGGNVLKNPCFATGKLKPWAAVGKAPGEGAISKKEVWDCKFAAFMGTSKPPSVSGLHGIQQSVKIPAKGKLTWWYFAGSNDQAQYADQEVDLMSQGKVVFQCFKKLVTNKTWTQGTCNLSKYAGKTYDLVLGVSDNGYSKTFVYWYVDDLSLASP